MYTYNFKTHYKSVRENILTIYLRTSTKPSISLSLSFSFFLFLSFSLVGLSAIESPLSKITAHHFGHDLIAALFCELCPEVVQRNFLLKYA